MDLLFHHIISATSFSYFTFQIMSETGKLVGCIKCSNYMSSNVPVIHLFSIVLNSHTPLCCEVE